MEKRRELRHLGAEFARALDEARFDEVAALLSRDCEYVIRGKTLRGVAEIVGSYREADEWVKATFDGIEYESSLAEIAEDSVLIEFVDRITHGGEELTHRCHQRIAADNEGRVCTIEHIDLPGEKGAVDAFNKRHGISRPG